MTVNSSVYCCYRCESIISQTISKVGAQVIDLYQRSRTRGIGIIFTFLGTIDLISANQKCSVIFNSVFVIARGILNLARVLK